MAEDSFPIETLPGFCYVGVHGSETYNGYPCAFEIVNEWHCASTHVSSVFGIGFSYENHSEHWFT
jgi:hypothetical protein